MRYNDTLWCACTLSISYALMRCSTTARYSLSAWLLSCIGALEGNRKFCCLSFTHPFNGRIAQWLAIQWARRRRNAMRYPNYRTIGWCRCPIPGCQSNSSERRWCAWQMGSGMGKCLPLYRLTQWRGVCLRAKIRNELWQTVYTNRSYCADVVNVAAMSAWWGLFCERTSSPLCVYAFYKLALFGLYICSHSVHTSTAQKQKNANVFVSLFRSQNAPRSFSLGRWATDIGHTYPANVYNYLSHTNIGP